MLAKSKQFEKRLSNGYELQMGGRLNWYNFFGKLLGITSKKSEDIFALLLNNSQLECLLGKHVLWGTKYTTQFLAAFLVIASNSKKPPNVR